MKVDGKEMFWSPCCTYHIKQNNGKKNMDEKEMFFSPFCNYNIKQNNGKKTWIATANIPCHAQTVIDHFGRETFIHQVAVHASIKQITF